jgi:hypothetical protein
MHYRFLRILLLASFTLILASCAKPKGQQDCGYVQNVYGERVSWKREVPVRLYIHVSVPPAYDASIRAAAESWNKAHGRQLIIIDPARVGGGGAARDGKNVIYLLSTWEPERASEQARTSLYWVGDQIQEADVRINGLNYQFYTTQTSVPGSGTISEAGVSGRAVNIESLIVHELGHVIGLRHNDASPSVMATYLKAHQERNQLQEADLVSLQCEY